MTAPEQLRGNCGRRVSTDCIETQTNPTSSNLHRAYQCVIEGLSIFGGSLMSDPGHVSLFINRRTLLPGSVPAKIGYKSPQGGTRCLKGRLAAKTDGVQPVL